MGNSQTPSRAELQRRRQQSARDRRRHEQEQEQEQEQLRRQQSARDRERNRIQQARTFCWSSPRLRQEIVTVDTSSVAATLETMPPALPWKSDSDSGRSFNR